MKVCRDVVGSATLKLSARSVCAGRRGLSWRFYLFTTSSSFFSRGARIPLKSRCGSEGLTHEWYLSVSICLGFL